jgi:hypothetical protein
MKLSQIVKTLIEGYAELLTVDELNEVTNKCYAWSSRAAFNLAGKELAARGL